MDHLEKLSEELVAVSRKVAPWIVRVNGRRGPNATGVLWNETKIVTSHRACHRDADLEIGLPAFQARSPILSLSPGRRRAAPGSFLGLLGTGEAIS